MNFMVDKIAQDFLTKSYEAVMDDALWIATQVLIFLAEVNPHSLDMGLKIRDAVYKHQSKDYLYKRGILSLVSVDRVYWDATRWSM